MDQSSRASSSSQLSRVNLKIRGVLPRALNQDLMTKTPSGGTITFDAYCKKKLYRNVQAGAVTAKSMTRNQPLVDFPEGPEDIPRAPNMTITQNLNPAMDAISE